MAGSSEDVIDSLAGIPPGSALDAVRARRPHARDQAQASFRALFEPEHAGGMSLPERFAVATFVAAVHAQPETAAFYRTRLAGAGAPAALQSALDEAVGAAAAHGPYGSYPPGPLSTEDRAGPMLRIAEASRAALGPRLAAALQHAHMLVFHPRDAAPEQLEALLGAGWSTTAIVTLSQLVAFLAYQIRAIAGLRTLAAHSGPARPP